MVLEVSVHDQMISLLWSYGEAANHGRHVSDKSPHLMFRKPKKYKEGVGVPQSPSRAHC
jgi:hypothetical protein